MSNFLYQQYLISFTKNLNNIKRKSIYTSYAQPIKSVFLKNICRFKDFSVNPKDLANGCIVSLGDETKTSVAPQ